MTERADSVMNRGQSHFFAGRTEMVRNRAKPNKKRKPRGGIGNTLPTSCVEHPTWNQFRGVEANRNAHFQDGLQTAPDIFGIAQHGVLRGTCSALNAEIELQIQYPVTLEERQVKDQMKCSSAGGLNDPIQDVLWGNYHNHIKCVLHVMRYGSELQQVIRGVVSRVRSTRGAFGTECSTGGGTPLFPLYRVLVPHLCCWLKT